MREQPPEAAAHRVHIGPAVARRQQARRDQARRREALGHGDDVAVHLGREDPVHRLQHRAPAVAAGQEVAAVDEAAADARDRGAVPPVEVGQDVRADVGDFVDGGLAHYFFASVTFTGDAMSRTWSCSALVHPPASAAPPGRLLQSEPM